ncbi:MAG: hypothetical protein ACK5IJ_01885 [Mangrovibacterium sp.]
MNDNKRLQQMQEQFIQSLPDNFSILEEPIDVNTQHHYFEYNKEIEPLSLSDFQQFDERTFESNDYENHRRLLAQLAKSDQVEAYRIIERYYHHSPTKKMNAWATLALQESRMMIESTLIDSNFPVFISTGLGGKGQSIRFFMVLVLNNLDDSYSQTQKKLIKTEINFQLAENGGELEQIRFSKCYASCTFLYPLKTQLQTFISNLIGECNQYGNFLREEIIITNVKKISLSEVQQFIEETELKNDNKKQ